MILTTRHYLFFIFTILFSMNSLSLCDNEVLASTVKQSLNRSAQQLGQKAAKSLLSAQSDIEKKYPSNEVLLEKLKNFVKNENYQLIIDDLTQLQSENTNFLDYSIILKYKSIANYNIKEYVEAEDDLKEFCHLYPKDSEYPNMLYLLAMSQYNQRGSNWDIMLSGDGYLRDTAFLDNAFQNFSLYLKHDPASPQRGAILSKMTEIKNLLAKKNLYDAKYDYDRKAHLGSLHRCEALLEQYPGSVVEEDALNLMSKNYQALGLTEESDEVLDIIHNNLKRLGKEA